MLYTARMAGGDDDRGATGARRLTVSQAATTLGISQDAVRGRIKRGTLEVEREGDRVYVLVSDQGDDRSSSQQTDRTDLLIAELQDRVRSLEEANSENRRIIAALTSRIPALEAPPGERESTESAAGGESDISPGQGVREPQTATERRPWWRRLIGG